MPKTTNDLKGWYCKDCKARGQHCIVLAMNIPGMPKCPFGKKATWRRLHG